MTLKVCLKLMVACVLQVLRGVRQGCFDRGMVDIRLSQDDMDALVEVSKVFEIVSSARINCD